MATTRIRRASANPSEPSPIPEEDRVYTEDDYAMSDPSAIPDEWEAEASVYPPGWTGENILPDEAFEPDDEENLAGEEWAREDAEGFTPYDEAGMPFVPYDDDADFDDLDPLDDALLSDAERAELRRSHWQLISGLADFAGVITGTAAILVLVTLLISLLNWLVGDLNQSFILLQKNL